MAVNIPVERDSTSIDGNAPSTVVIPVAKPFSLIPVGLKEAALDSPSFRAATVHFSDQVDAIERWLDNVVKSATKLSQEVTALESAVQSLWTHTGIPNNLSEASLDQDYTTLALKRFNEGSKDFWSHTIGGIRRTQHSMIEPIRQFLSNEIRPYKDARRLLDACQKTYDSILARYLSQAKGKEASALREDAFQLHEARKAYLKASMDLCVLGPQTRVALDALLIKVFTDQWLEMKRIREDTSTSFAKSGLEVERVRSWSREMQSGESTMRKQLLLARREIERSAEASARPPRDLEVYSASTVPYLGSPGPAASQQLNNESVPNSKQGYLMLKTVSGKPARTTWVRRWCFCKNSVFGWLVQGAKSGGVEESEKIGVLLCGVRPAFQEERRFCFEVKTKDTTTVLQAETQAELMEWISVFEVVKRKALEEPENADLLTNMTSPSGDAAFAVNPPTAPEFAAKEDVGSLAFSDEIGSPALGADLLEYPAAAASRSSFDVQSMRRTEKDGERERTRDHAARIIHKLDLHKKSGADAQMTATTTQSSSAAAPIGGGIASLIAASHSSLPVGPGRPPVLQTKDKISAGPNITSTLAPDTLVNPPSQTNLTRTAILVGMDRGYDLGLVDETGGMPSGLMANQWGTINHGQIARIDRGEVRAGNILDTARTRLDEALPDNVSDRVAGNGGSASKEGTPQSKTTARSMGHRKTVSAADGKLQASTTLSRRAKPFADFPSYYPTSLRPHDAQFRMLFPNIDTDERVVLIFRSSWNADNSQALPARTYVTINGMYFYSHHFGFVLVSAIGFDSIVDISAAAGQGHDYLYFKAKMPEGRGDDVIVPAKVYLEPLPLLLKRLNYLLANSGAEEPDNLEQAINTLVAFEREIKDDAAHIQRADSISIDPRNQFQGRIKVDRSTYSGNTAAYADPEVAKFRLPAHPVNYVPAHFADCAASKTYNVSAKALFHIMFGDKSALFQLLYHERRSRSVRQSPWTKAEDGRFNRTFDYTISAKDSLKRSRQVAISDSQVIDVSNDHLCYAVTDLKTPWHLPSSRDFTMVSKIVITHVAKSKCKLAIYTKVEWVATPWLRVNKSVINLQALDDLHLDALDVMDLVTEQVDKLGPNTYTKKALAIFGPIGVSTEISQIVSADPSITGKPVRVAITRKSTFGLFVEFMRSITVSAISVMLMSVIGIVRNLWKVFDAQKLLLAILAVSVCFNMFSTSSTVRNWWHDRSTAKFMARLGVTPDMHMSRAVYLKDLQDLAPSNVAASFSSASVCATSFQDLLVRAEDHNGMLSSDTISMDPGSQSVVRRLRSTRRRFGSYRHDLLVSLRMVNSLEREMMQSEYESWLGDETEKCDRLQRLLEKKSSANKNDTQRLRGNGVQVAQDFLDDYCLSCRAEQKAVGNSLG